MGKRRTRDVEPAASVQSLRKGSVEAEIDLHGLDATAAATKLEAFLMRCARTYSGRVVRVVTGIGHRSEGRAVLRPLVRDLLAGRLASYVAEFSGDSGGGAFLVKVR